jgi:uncharacterized membrane protein
MASLLQENRFATAAVVQFFLILVVVAIFAYVSYVYIPNNVPQDKRANTQIYVNVAFTCTTAIISASTFLLNYYLEHPTPIVRTKFLD